MANPFSPIVALGVSGSGKTYGMQRRVTRAIDAGWAGAVVLDPNDEWTRGGPHEAIPAARSATPTGLARAIVSGRRLVIHQPAGELVGETPLRADAERIARYAAAAHGPWIVILPEVHMSAPEGRPLPPAIAALVHRGRHPRVGASLWCDTQHPRDLHKRILNEARIVEYYATGSRRDLDELRRVGGPELVTAVRRAAERMERGEPGWHVTLRPLSSSPPYELER